MNHWKRMLRPASHLEIQKQAKKQFVSQTKKQTNENDTTTTNGILRNTQTTCPTKQCKLAYPLDTWHNSCFLRKKQTCKPHTCCSRRKNQKDNKMTINPAKGKHIITFNFQSFTSFINATQIHQIKQNQFPILHGFQPSQDIESIPSSLSQGRVAIDIIVYINK